jgi:serine/threonine-protein kinase
MLTDAVNWVGATLDGRYRVVSRLGEGGMGFVYRARDTRLDADVVIKVPRPSMLEDPGFADRFAREIRSLVRLEHPHIVRVSDVGTHDGLPFAVMQFLPGGSLRDRQRHGPDRRPVPGALADLHTWLATVADALDFIHARKYVHRDVKPDNILFDAAGHATLSDFGIAKAVSEGAANAVRSATLTGVGMVLGTPHFMAPELIMGQPFDGRVDQYALAVTVYELLAGRYPFEGPNAAAIFVLHTTDQAPPLASVRPEVPVALSVAVARAMAKDPGQRFPHCTAFARAALDALALPEVAAAPAAEDTQPRVPCPNCGKPCRMRPELAGQRVRCPKCKTAFHMPGAMPARTPAAPLTAAETSQTARALTPTPTTLEPPPVPARPVAGRAPQSELWQGLAADPGLPALAGTPRPAEEEAIDDGKTRRLTFLLAGLLGLVMVAGVVGGMIWALTNKAAPSATHRSAEVAGSRPTNRDTAPPPTVPRDVEKKQPQEQPPPDVGPPVRPVVTFMLLPPGPLQLEAGKPSTLPVRVRRLGFRGSIRVVLDNLPEGVRHTPTTLTLGEGQDTDSFTLHPAADAAAASGEAQVVAIGGDIEQRQPFRFTLRKNAPAAPPPTPTPPTPQAPRTGLLASWPLKAQCVAISPDGRLGVTGEKNGGLIIWDLDRKQELRRLSGHSGEVTGVAFAPGSEFILSAGRDGMLRGWDVARGNQVRSFGSWAVLSLAVTGDGRLALTGHQNGFARLWNATDGIELRALGSAGPAVQAVALSPDGQLALTGGGTIDGKDTALRLWDTSNGKEKGKLFGHTKRVHCVAFSDDGRLAVSGGDDHTVRVWDVPGRKLIGTYTKHTRTVLSVAFAPKAGRVLSAGLDKTVQYWDVASLEPVIPPMQHKGTVSGVALSGDGRRALSVSEGDGIRLWGLPE